MSYITHCTKGTMPGKEAIMPGLRDMKKTFTVIRSDSVDGAPVALVGKRFIHTYSFTSEMYIWEKYDMTCFLNLILSIKKYI